MLLRHWDCSTQGISVGCDLIAHLVAHLFPILFHPLYILSVTGGISFLLGMEFEVHPMSCQIAFPSVPCPDYEPPLAGSALTTPVL